jgi:DNA-binding IclR family transcriptional regulator
VRGRPRDIRETGVVTTTGEVDSHSTAVGAPVLLNQRLLCALSVAGPSVRFGDERVREIVPIVRAEADQLGRVVSAAGGGS